LDLASLPASLLLHVEDDSQIGEARRMTRLFGAARRLPDDVGATAGLIATELATNIVRYGRGGILQVQWFPQGGGVLEVMAVDRGPGMRNVAHCLEDGFSTGGTMGTGLGAVRRIASEFDIYSWPEQGTVVLARLASGDGDAGRDAALRFGAFSKTAPGEQVSGDTWRANIGADTVSFMVADGLGHGPSAAEAADAVAAVFDSNPGALPSQFLATAHARAASTRGAAVASIRIDTRSRAVEYAGIGNIAAMLVTPNSSKGMVSHNGTVGAQIRKIQSFSYDWPDEAVLVIHSDGIQSRWSLEKYPGLFGRHPSIIAALIGRDFVRGRDDLTVLVADMRGNSVVH